MSHMRKSSMDLDRDFRAFTSELKCCSKRLTGIVSELDEAYESTRQRREGVPQRATLAASTIGVGAGGGVIWGLVSLTPFTCGMSLMLAGITAGAAAAGAAVAAVFHNEKISDKETVKQVEKLFGEFLETVGSLSPLLEDLKTTIKDLDRDTEAVVRTQTRIQDLSSLLWAFTKEATVERLLEVKEQCSRTLQELTNLSVR